MRTRKVHNMGIGLANNGSNKGIRVFEKEKDGRPLLEAVQWIFHHQVQKSTAASQTLDFFQSASGASNLVTNLTTSAQLAKPNEFYMYGVSVTPAYGTPLADLQALYNSSMINFNISGKQYINQRLMYVPSSGLTGFDPAAVIASNLSPMQNSFYSILADGIPQHIVDQEAFGAQIVVAAAGAFSAAFDITYGLHGLLARPIV